ncbi:MAG: L,D-transpeptidase [Campylobacterota bacterium]|nr:L,D-transpeptidase [Campylobacterota bacterium]
MHIITKFSFFIFITLFFYNFSKIYANPFDTSFLNIEQSQNSFLSVLYADHENFLQETELKRIREETKELVRIAKALAKKKKLEKLARNKIVAKIDISQQRMKVYKGGKLLYKWKVSTGKKGYRTPTGFFRPTVLKKMHFSSQYNNSPMPYSIFFNGGIAIHGTKSVKRLGRKASHGCIRVRTYNAKKLYALMRKSGKNNSYIEVRH